MLSDHAPADPPLRLVVDADDYPEAVAFYRDLLGLSELEVRTTAHEELTVLVAASGTLEIVRPVRSA